MFVLVSVDVPAAVAVLVSVDVAAAVSVLVPGAMSAAVSGASRESVCAVADAHGDAAVDALLHDAAGTASAAGIVGAYAAGESAVAAASADAAVALPAGHPSALTHPSSCTLLHPCQDPFFHLLQHPEQTIEHGGLGGVLKWLSHACRRVLIACRPHLQCLHHSHPPPHTAAGSSSVPSAPFAGISSSLSFFEPFHRRRRCLSREAPVLADYARRLPLQRWLLQREF